MSLYARRFVEALLRCGVDVCSGVSGGRILPFIQAVGATDGMTVVSCRNEQGAAFMADAHYRATGRLACCFSTSGPGATNLLTGVSGAFADSIPMVVVTGQSELASWGRGGIQEGSGVGRSPDVRRQFASVVKGAWYLDGTLAPEEVATAAVSLAMAGRPGPVHIDVPFDVWAAPVGERPPLVASNNREEQPSQLSAGALSQVIDALSTCKRPLLLLGRGANGCATEVRGLAQRFGIPVATSLGARGVLDENDPLSLGMIGCYGQDAANHYLIDVCDGVLAVGISFQYLTTLGWHDALQRKLLCHVDIDATELGKAIPSRCGIRADAREFLLALAAAPLRGLDPTEDVAAARRRFGGIPSDSVKLASDAAQTGVPPVQIFETLNREYPDTTVVLDSGENAYWGMFSLIASHGRRILSNNAWGSMGYSIPGAVAAALATDKLAIGVCGDGGFLMNGLESTVAVEKNLKCLWIVMDNGCYGTQRHWQRDHYGGAYYATSMPPIDYASLARGLSLEYGYADRTAALSAELARLSRSTPALLHVKVDGEVKPPRAYGSTLVK